MKTTANILTLIILTIISGCRESANPDLNSITQNNSIPETPSKTDLTKEERKKQIEAENRIDSLRLDIALKDAFKVAQLEFITDDFKKEYEIQPDDSSFIIKIEILIGRLFKDNQKVFSITQTRSLGNLPRLIQS